MLIFVVVVKVVVKVMVKEWYRLGWGVIDCSDRDQLYNLTSTNPDQGPNPLANGWLQFPKTVRISDSMILQFSTRESCSDLKPSKQAARSEKRRVSAVIAPHVDVSIKC